MGQQRMCFLEQLHKVRRAAVLPFGIFGDRRTAHRASPLSVQPQRKAFLAKDVLAFEKRWPPVIVVTNRAHRTGSLQLFASRISAVILLQEEKNNYFKK